MTRLVVTEDADADLEQILAYLEREAGPRVRRITAANSVLAWRALSSFQALGPAARPLAPTPGLASSGRTS